jgi:hypothetical protein
MVHSFFGPFSAVSNLLKGIHFYTQKSIRT